MGTILVSDIFTRVSTLLNDAGAVRWPETELLGWYNEGLLDMVVRRPDLLPVAEETFVCTPGTQQQLPANRIKLVDVGRNLGPVASPRYGAVPQLVGKDLMDRLCPSWQSDVAKSVVNALVTSPAMPDLFFVWPPQSTTSPGRLALTFLKKPDSVLVVSGAVFELSDEYTPIMVEYLLYRSMQKDSENPAMAQLANQHLQTYLGMLGSSTQPPQQPQQG